MEGTVLKEKNISEKEDWRQWLGILAQTLSLTLAFIFIYAETFWYENSIYFDHTVENLKLCLYGTFSVLVYSKILMRWFQQIVWGTGPLRKGL